MRVLFRFRNAKLLQPQARHVFADGVDDVFLVEENVEPLEGGVVRGHRRERERLHIALRGLRENARELARAVVAEVEEDDGVAILNAADGAAGSIRPHDGLHEFIGDAGGVGVFDRLHKILRRRALPVNEEVVGLFDALPALVAVHRVVASDHAREHCTLARGGKLLLKALYEPEAALRIRVAPVHEGMNEYLADPFFFSKINKGEEVLEACMHAAVGKESHQMERRIACLCVSEKRGDFGLRGERARLAGAVDAHEVLIDHAACADVEVADFGIAHLAGGEPHVFAEGEEFGMRAALHERFKIGRMRGRNGISRVGCAAADAPAVKNHKKDFMHLESLADSA